MKVSQGEVGVSEDLMILEASEKYELLEVLWQFDPATPSSTEDRLT